MNNVRLGLIVVLAVATIFFVFVIVFTQKNNEIEKLESVNKNKQVTLENLQQSKNRLEENLATLQSKQTCKQYRGYRWNQKDLEVINKTNDEKTRCEKDLKKFWTQGVNDKYPGCGTAFCCEEICTTVKDNDSV